MVKSKLIIIGGPNGAGKSTSAKEILPAAIPFINADEIEKSLPHGIRGKAIAAGRELVAQWSLLQESSLSFAVESTLASRSLAPKVARMKTIGFEFKLLYFWLPTIDIAIDRVAERVRLGGHDIPVNTIRRRYTRSLQNLFELYMPLADDWAIYINRAPGIPDMVAFGGAELGVNVLEATEWENMHAASSK